MLAELLRMDSMGASELKRAVQKNIPRELSVVTLDGTLANARELLVSEGIQASGMIPTQVFATIMEGAEPAKCMREIFPTYTMSSQVLKVPVGEAGTYAPKVAEGAEVPMQDQTYTPVTFTVSKYAVRPSITREMIADASFDVIAAEIRKAGSRMENAYNYLAMEQFLAVAGDAGTYETDCGGSGATPLAFTGTAMGTMIGRGFRPTKLIMTPVFYGKILNGGASLANNLGVELTRSGSVGQIYGMQSFVLGTSQSAASATKTWAFAADGNKGALLIDPMYAAAFGIREDISVEQYADPIRDLQGMVIRARFDFEVMQQAASQTIQY
jgi:hypothetical protein